MTGDDGTPIGPWTDSADLPWPPPSWRPPVDLGPVGDLAGIPAPDGGQAPAVAPAMAGDVSAAVPIPPPPLGPAGAASFGAPPLPQLGALSGPDQPQPPPVPLGPIGDLAGIPPPSGPAQDAPPPPLSTERLAFPFGPVGDLAGVPGVVMPSPADQHYAETAKQLDANPFDATGDVRGDLDPKETQRYFNDLYARDPLKAQELESTIRARREKMTADAQSEQLRANIEAQRRNYANYQREMERVKTRRAQIDADSDRLAAQRIDPMAGISTGQSIAGIVGAMIGGLYQARHGGENMGLKSWMATIDRNIERQRADITNRRSALERQDSVLAREVAEHGDVLRASEAMREAAVKQMDAELARRQLDFSPRGTTFMGIAKDRAQLAASMAEHRQKTDQKAWEDGLKLNDAYRQERAQQETERQNRAQNYLRALEIQESAATRRDANAARRDDKAYERTDKENERVRQYAIGGIPSAQLGQDGNPVIDKDGKAIVNYDVLRNKDGSIWLAESPEATRELRQKAASAENVASIIDEIRSIRGRVGGESKLLNSAERQRLEVLQARARLLTKEGTQGMSSDKDAEVLSDASGTGDAASWRDQDARLLEARERTTSALNVALRKAKYSGPDIRFPDLTNAKRADIADDTETGLKSRGTGNPERVRSEELARQARALGVPIENGVVMWSRKPGAWEQARDAANAATQDYGSSGVTPKQRGDISDLADRAISGDRASLETLQNLTRPGQANSKAVVQLAKEALNRIEFSRRDAATGAGPATDAQVPTGAFTAPVSPTFPGGR